MTGLVRILRVGSVAAALFVIVNMALSSSSFGVIAILFILWNVAPCLIAYKALGSPAKIYPATGYSLGAVAVTLFFHIHWMFDIGGSQTGSSTSALIFIFIPFYAIGAGLLAALLGLGLSKLNRPPH